MAIIQPNVRVPGRVTEVEAKREHVLAAIRRASSELLLSKAEIDHVGVALRGYLIGTEEALDWLEQLGAMPLIDIVVERENA